MLQNQASKPVLAIDFDNTLVFNAQRIVDTYNDHHKTKISLLNTYVEEALVDPGGNNSQDVKDWIGGYLHSEEALTTQPILGSIDALKRLQVKYSLCLVTGRSPDWDKPTREWLDRFLTGLIDELYFSNSEPKADICHSIGAIALIDDSPKYLIDCVNSGIKAILYGDYPWNQGEVPAGVQRAKNWKEVEEILS